MVIEMNFKPYLWATVHRPNEIGPLLKSRLWSLGQLSGEISDRLGVDLALVPLLQDREVWRPRLVVLAALPAIASEIIRGRGQHVGRAAQQVAFAVTVTSSLVLN